MNRIIYRTAPILYITISLILFTTCGNPDPARESSGTKPFDGTSQDLSGKTIGLSMYTLSAPYFVALAKSIEERVKAQGIDFIFMDAQDDILRQVGTVEDLLVQGIDLLILNPLDPHALVMATKLATRANVPVIIIDSSIDPAADFITTIQSNNLKNGELVGEWLVKEMGDQPIKAAVLSGAQGNPVGKERRQGLFRGIIEQQFRTYGKASMDLVAQGWGNWTYEGGLTAMEDILVAHTDINVLISEQDAMAMGALQAITEAGKKEDILIVAGADGQKEAFELIMKGEYGATGLNNPVLISEMAVEIAFKVLAGEKNFPKLIYTPAVCVSKENVEKYYDPESIF